MIGIVKCSVTKPPDLAEHSINKTADIVENVMVLDSTNNGFRVVYATAEPVTNEKYDEICSRPNIQQGFNRLKREAPGISEVLCYIQTSVILPSMLIGFR